MKQITMSTLEIAEFKPCSSGIKKLLRYLNKKECDSEQIPLLTILESNGIKDTIWCFRINWSLYKPLYTKFINNCVIRAKNYTAGAADAAAGAADAAAGAERVIQTEDLKQLLLNYID